MNYFNLLFSNNSILRCLQIDEFRKFSFRGDCIEFGANKKINRNFLQYNSKKYKITYSNLINKNNNFLILNLEKKIKHKKKYDNVVIFNVLEHLANLDTPIENIYNLLKKRGRVIGSTPFIYRIHGAPKDYSRYTKDYLKKILKEKKFKQIEIYELGIGPFLASFSLLRGYLKFVPIVYQTLLFLVIITDKILNIFMKTNPKTIYPIGYVFSAVKK
jgi:SAM-dependent methyltransferase